MSALLTITRAGPLTSIQDDGRFGMLRHGISASGPMDRGAFAMAGEMIWAGQGGVEFTTAGLALRVDNGRCRVGLAGGSFVARHNGQDVAWPGTATLEAGDTLAITPGPSGNYGYLRFDADIAVPSIMGSIATSSRARLGGHDGRVLRPGDTIQLHDATHRGALPVIHRAAEGPIHVTWGLHADLFAPPVRQLFVQTAFCISQRLDRMGVRLDDPGAVFAGAASLSLVSDAIVPGDIQILGDGTPTVLMRDHQPTGGYARIATVITADLDRFAQMRPGTPVAFSPVTVEHAQALLRSRRP